MEKVKRTKKALEAEVAKLNTAVANYEDRIKQLESAHEKALAVAQEKNDSLFTALYYSRAAEERLHQYVESAVDLHKDHMKRYLETSNIRAKHDPVYRKIRDHYREGNEVEFSYIAELTTHEPRAVGIAEEFGLDLRTWTKDGAVYASTVWLHHR